VAARGGAVQLELLHRAHHRLGLGVGVVVEVAEAVRLALVHVVVDGVDCGAAVLDVLVRGTVELGRVGDGRNDRVELLGILPDESATAAAAASADSSGHQELAVVHARLGARLRAGDAALAADEPRDDTAVVAGQGAPR